MRKNFSKPISIDEALKNGRLYIDTNVWFHMAFMAVLIRRLARLNVPIYILAYVVKELKKHAAGDNKDLQEKAQRALKNIDSLVKQGLCIIDDRDYGAHEIGDAPFHAAFDRLRFEENVIFLTRDNNNAYDTLMLNYRRSARSWRKIQCWTIYDNGLIDTTFYQKRFSFPTEKFETPRPPVAPRPVTNTAMKCSDCETYSSQNCQSCRDNAKQAAKQDAIHAKPPAKKFEEPVEKLTCVDCGSVFDLTASNKRYFVLKGMVPPKRCQACRDRIKQAMKQTPAPRTTIGHSSSNECVGVSSGGAAHGFFSALGGFLGC